MSLEWTLNGQMASVTNITKAFVGFFWYFRNLAKKLQFQC